MINSTPQAASSYQQPIQTKGSDSGSGVPSLPPMTSNNLYAVLFFVLLSAMTIRQGTVLSESKEINDNASIQNQLNKQNDSIQFSILPTKAGTATINRVQDQNEQYAALRENIQNSLIIARQVAEVTMTQASTNVNLLQQDASENSGWLQTITTIFQVIDGMNQSQ